MNYVYILKSIEYPKTYVGSTTDIARRMKEHKSGKTEFSKKYKPWMLIYKEEFLNILEARKREKYFKSAAGRRFIKRILGKN
ncbi:MAG: GIY-YIG nuclease family protein [Candidatus Nealsonbacteria bacterium]|nr:GIY-YIG nuclease family protein [Candidatus Nealsonbacteria bacterium]